MTTASLPTSLRVQICCYTAQEEAFCKELLKKTASKIESIAGLFTVATITTDSVKLLEQKEISVKKLIRFPTELPSFYDVTIDRSFLRRKLVDSLGVRTPPRQQLLYLKPQEAQNISRRATVQIKQHPVEYDSEELIFLINQGSVNIQIEFASQAQLNLTIFLQNWFGKVGKNLNVNFTDEGCTVQGVSLNDIPYLDALSQRPYILSITPF